MERIYALCYGAKESPLCFYVGKTARTVEQRFTEHLKGMRNPLDPKPAYEYARHIGIDDVWILELDTTESGLTENDYVRALILEGHPLTNANEGNRKEAKKRTTSAFCTINRDAMARTSSERRNRLHSDAQVLTKPELVRQRVTGELPSAEELDAMDWRESWVEMLPFKPLPKRPEEIKTEMLKYGDLNIFLAFKKGKWAYWIKNTRTGLADAYRASWRTARKGFTRLDALEQVLAEYPPIGWWPLHD